MIWKYGIDRPPLKWAINFVLTNVLMPICNFIYISWLRCFTSLFEYADFPLCWYWKVLSQIFVTSSDVISTLARRRRRRAIYLFYLLFIYCHYVEAGRKNPWNADITSMLVRITQHVVRVLILILGIGDWWVNLFTCITTEIAGIFENYIFKTQLQVIINKFIYFTLGTNGLSP